MPSDIIRNIQILLARRLMSQFSTTILFHVCEEHLSPGDLIPPGRWGDALLSAGQEHPYFFREQLLEIWRQKFTSVLVSRFSCTFAFEELKQAQEYATESECIYRVVPVDSSMANARLDMVWIASMGDAHTNSAQVAYRCSAYWAGTASSRLSAAANPTWEWLFSCALRVEEQVSARSALPAFPV